MGEHIERELAISEIDDCFPDKFRDKHPAEEGE